MRGMKPAGVALVGAAASLLIGCRGGGPARERAVLFVCEHGAAKSVIAAALFNARASARRLPFRAESRGVVPEPTLMPAAVAGLRSDGLAPGRGAPRRISRADVDRAALVVAFDPLPPDLTEHVRVEVWDGVPPVSVDYSASRDAMLSRVDVLLDELARGGGTLDRRAE